MSDLHVTAEIASEFKAEAGQRLLDVYREFMKTGTMHLERHAGFFSALLASASAMYAGTHGSGLRREDVPILEQAIFDAVIAKAEELRASR